MEQVYDRVAVAVTFFNVDLLISLWEMSFLGREGVIVRALITKYIPKIASFYGIPERYPFPDFVRIYEAGKLEQDLGVDKALKELVRRKNLDGVLYLMEKQPEQLWLDVCMYAMEFGENELAKFFFDKFTEEEKVDLLDSLLMNAVAYDNSEMFFFFLNLVDNKEDAVTIAFDSAVNYGHFDLATQIYNLGYVSRGQVDYLIRMAKVLKDDEMVEYLESLI
jgi:hypothetical protein